MNKFALFAAGVASLAIAAPAYAATVVTFAATNPGGAVTLLPAGPGAVSRAISFDVQGTGDFTATFTFDNPFEFANATGSASFDFDPDILNFTDGDFSGTGSVAIGVPGSGSAITVSRGMLESGAQTLTFMGTLNSSSTPAGGNNFARIGGSLNLVEMAAVPEPATWAMFILGFGMLGAGLRRRNAQVRATNARLTFA